MTTVRDSIFDLGQFQIPRPKCIGMEFVTIRGTHSGFYRSINKNIALKYGLLQQRNLEVSATKRPSIPEEWTKNNEEDERKNKKNNGSIPEEPENVSEPLPDYEIEGNERNEERKESITTIAIKMSERKDAIAVKSELDQLPSHKEEIRMALSANNN
ncbi:hypothetical protein ACQ4LE_001117, partial [Meloidogyne hapla]